MARERAEGSDWLNSECLHQLIQVKVLLGARSPRIDQVGHQVSTQVERPGGWVPTSKKLISLHNKRFKDLKNKSHILNCSV